MSTQEIKVTPLSSDELDLACQTLSEVGYVTFEQAIPLEIVEKIKDSVTAKIVTLDGTIIGNESILNDLI